MKYQDMEPYASFEREYRRRQIIADDANEAVNLARGTYPILTPGSTRETLIAWLCCVDHNGCWTDHDMLAEYGEAMTLSDAWEQVAMMAEDTHAYNHACADVTPDALAAAFARELLDWLGAETLAKVDRENAVHAHKGDHGICASADHCDSNMAMVAAYEALGFPAPNPGCQACNAQWNEAWAIAKTRGFVLLALTSRPLVGGE